MMLATFGFAERASSGYLLPCNMCLCHVMLQSIAASALQCSNGLRMTADVCRSSPVLVLLACQLHLSLGYERDDLGQIWLLLHPARLYWPFSDFKYRSPMLRQHSCSLFPRICQVGLGHAPALCSKVTTQA